MIKLRAPFVRNVARDEGSDNALVVLLLFYNQSKAHLGTFTYSHSRESPIYHTGDHIVSSLVENGIELS